MKRHLDLVQCHDIEFGDLDRIVHETLRPPREVRGADLVQAVGITGYPLGALRYVTSRAPAHTNGRPENQHPEPQS